MTKHEKASTCNVLAALILLATVIIRHTSTSPTALRWADDFMPPIAFILIAIGIYYMYQAKKVVRR
jgi:hypothetical protein